MKKKYLERAFFDTAGKSINLKISRMVNAGYAGANQENIRKHIEELAVMGVPGPKHLPTYYPVPANQLVTDDIIQVASKQTSAEVEFVLIFGNGKTYLTVGSDHTDRGVESLGVALSKQVCPNIAAKTVWNYDEVKDHFSEIRLICHVKDQGEWREYQNDSVAALLPPAEILEKGASVFGEIEEGTVLFSGTVPTIGEMTFGEAWRIAMVDPVLNRKIEHEYLVDRLADSID